MNHPKVVIVLFVLLAVLFAVGLTVGLARKDAGGGPPASGALAGFEGVLYPLTPRASFKGTVFHSGEEITDDQAVDANKTPFRMVKFYLANPQCSFEITYTPPSGQASGLGKSSGPPKPVVLPSASPDHPGVREGLVTLLAPGGKLKFRCTSTRPGHSPKTCLVSLSPEGK